MELFVIVVCGIVGLIIWGLFAIGLYLISKDNSDD